MRTKEFKEIAHGIREAGLEEIWQAVLKQAERSTLNSFRTGAIVFSKSGEIIGKGCSHHRAWSSKASVHAEDAALEDAHDAEDHNILIASIGKAGNPAYSSKPCLSCAMQLEKRGVQHVYFLERLNDGWWIMNVVTPSELVEQAILSDTRLDNYAREMRI
jgi:deoxycytidylate deaminase